jgi:signal transduction histidine kinase
LFVSGFFAMDLFWLSTVAVLASVSAAVTGLVLFQRPRRFDATRFPAGLTAFARVAPASAGDLDVAAEVHTVLDRLGPQARQQLVTFTAAIEPGLLVHADAATFRQALADLVGNAIQRTPCGTVLLTGGRRGGRVEVSVGDDGATDGLPGVESALRGAAQLVALQGGTLEIDMRPGEGTIATMRLPEAHTARPDADIAMPAGATATGAAAAAATGTRIIAPSA